MSKTFYHDVPAVRCICPMRGMHYHVFDTPSEARAYAERLDVGYGLPPGSHQANSRFWDDTVFEQTWVNDHRKK